MFPLMPCLLQIRNSFFFFFIQCFKCLYLNLELKFIGLYYFILLAIIGSSTVTTSMFVFLEKDLKRNNHIPWYLHWLSYDINIKLPR